MGVDTKRLRELARKATPGPWEPCSMRMYVFSARGEIIADASDDGGLEMRGHGAGLPMEENCEYIAALSPDVLLALLDERDALEKRIKDLEQQIANGAPQ